MIQKIKDFFNKIKWHVLIGGVCIIVGCCCGVIIGCKIYKRAPDPPIIVVEPGKPGKPIYTKLPPGNIACGPTIEMKGVAVGPLFKVLAWDECKSVEQSWKLKLTSPIKHHTIVIGYGLPYNIDLKKINHLLDGAYYYNLDTIGLGGGAVAIFDRNRLYDIGPRISVKATFN